MITMARAVLVFPFTLLVMLGLERVLEGRYTAGLLVLVAWLAIVWLCDTLEA